MVQANENNSEDTQCLGFDHSHPAPSCQQILDYSPSISSGHFWLGTEENVVLMFCDMNRTCGGVSGGWLRLIALDMRDENPPCPSNLMLIEESGKDCVLEILVVVRLLKQMCNTTWCVAEQSRINTVL